MADADNIENQKRHMNKMYCKPFTIKLSGPYYWKVFAVLLAALPCVAAVRAEAQQITIDSIHLNALVYNLTNGYRASKGLPRLTAGLGGPAAAAQKYAEYQAAHNTTGHQDDGRTPQQRIEAEGGKVCHYSENVYHYYSPNLVDIQTVGHAAIDWWKNSPGHELNMRTTSDHDLWTGSAAWKYGDGYHYYIVQDYFLDCDEKPWRRLGRARPQ